MHDPKRRRTVAFLLTAALTAPLAAALSVEPAPAPAPVVPTAPAPTKAAPTPSAASLTKAAQSAPGLRERLLDVADGLEPAVLDRALAAHAAAKARGDLAKSPHPERLTVIDYSRASSEKRLWVLDLDTGELLFHEHVAHGQGSGDDVPSRFGNDEGSHQSSLGVFRTAETYVGKHGRSLRLDGLEQGVNDQARARAVVVHGADYVSQDFIAAHGRLGRSWGCPAVRPAVTDALIDAIGGGCLVFAYYPDDAWLGSSKYLN